ncbi:MAG: hypothetical protein ACYCQI_00430 [Gammaproteobacteria bacterium]
MKAKLLMTISLIFLAISNLANGYNNYKGEVMEPEPQWQTASCAQANCGQSACATQVASGCGGGCGQGDSCSSGLFLPSCYSCACADVNCNSNPCMTSCRYCRDFGNMGNFEFKNDL